ncbi:MAG: phospholipase D-like domain-containing protein [Bdellovibrionota bacterium]|nr:phospholipase D-like domain-containing protein [Bdellovibrionota bacterium]
MKNFILALCALFTLSLNAKVGVLFHPYDNTFDAIVERLKGAKETVDLALYNMDSSESNPIIKYLSSEEFKAKGLQVRMIFEGYAKKEDNLKKMLQFEEMGIDVRSLRSSKKMHHKFAVIDGHRSDASVITGSANWSMSSFKNYNENILFFDQEGAMAQSFFDEFNFLWEVSEEIGASFSDRVFAREESSAGLGEAYFNKDNFVVKRGRLSKKRGELGFTLTRKVVDAIDEAQEVVEIATTRLKLRPIYNAIIRAAKRGVEVKILVTMGEYDWERQRNKMNLPHCEDEYDRECSSGVNYVSLLGGDDFEGHELIDVRLKFFSVLTSAYLNKQMHSKYLIIDNDVVLSGSFNWSYSGEFNHIENVVKIERKESQDVLNGFNKDFDRLWNLRREALTPLHEQISLANQKGEKMSCGFAPMALEHDEIDALLRRGQKHCR